MATTAAARHVMTALVEAAMHFKHYRLPELFAGFSQQDFDVPVRYPVACHPQAWAAGTVPYLLATMLGLTPEAFERRLRIVRPLLPAFVDRLELRGLRVADARVDMRFERTGDTDASGRVLAVEGALDVTVEGAAPAPT